MSGVRDIDRVGRSGDWRVGYSERWRLAGLFAPVSAILLVIVFVVASLSTTRPKDFAATSSTTTTVDRSRSPMRASDPTRMPSGFPGDEGGARAAAIAYASVVEQRMLYLDDRAVEKAQRQISASPRFDQLLVDRRESIKTWRESVKDGSGQLWWVVVPLASKVESVSPVRASVSVWVSFIVSRTGAAAPKVWFGIQNIELSREGDGWKVWAESLEPGPTPQLSPAAKPSTASDLASELAGFELVEGAP